MIKRERYHTRIGVFLVLALLAAIVAILAGSDQAEGSVVNHDEDSTATSFAICAWIGVDEGVLGIPGTTLIHYHNFIFYGEVWVHCRVEIRVRVGDFWRVSCHDFIVDRGNPVWWSGGVVHLGPTACTAPG